MTLLRAYPSAEAPPDREPDGAVYQGDCTLLMPTLMRRYGGRIQLIYLDPPFQSGAPYYHRARVGEAEWASGRGSLALPAYSDRAPRDEYLKLMREALEGARGLLTDSGAIFLHADFRMHAHLKLLMDEVFGEENFLNEIIWTYQTGGRARRYFSRKHDVILFYAKSADYRFRIEAVPVSRAENRRNHMKRHVDADGRTYRSIKSGGKVYTYYDDAPAYPGDVWDDVSHLQQKDPQRTGYDTQKPSRLLDRIVLCASDPGDWVADLFAGSGTSLESAHRNGRKFLGVDESPLAIQTARRRLAGAAVEAFAPPFTGNPIVSADAVPAIAHYQVDLRAFQLEVGLCPRRFAGLDALDSWSVGYLRDGAYFEYAAEIRTRKRPAIAGSLPLPAYGGTPCLKVTDVIGRCFHYEMVMEGGACRIGR